MSGMARQEELLEDGFRHAGPGRGGPLLVAPVALVPAGRASSARRAAQVEGAEVVHGGGWGRHGPAPAPARAPHPEEAPQIQPVPPAARLVEQGAGRIQEPAIPVVLTVTTAASTFAQEGHDGLIINPHNGHDEKRKVGKGKDQTGRPTRLAVTDRLRRAGEGSAPLSAAWQRCWSCCVFLQHPPHCIWRVKRRKKKKKKRQTR